MVAVSTMALGSAVLATKVWKHHKAGISEEMKDRD